jgi:hypothetical protein
MVNTQTAVAVYAKIENKPGALARLTRAIGDRHLNIDAISLETVGETGFARIHAPRPREIVQALRMIGLECYESPTIVASIPDRPGELARAAAEIAAAGINIESVTVTTDGRLSFRTNDNDRAEQILRKL